MERDALIIRSLALDIVKDLKDLPCDYDLGEQVQRAGTALHLFFSEIFDAGDWGEACFHAESALRVALEFRVLARHVGLPPAGLEKTEMLVFTLRSYRSGGGKFRKFARRRKGGIS